MKPSGRRRCGSGRGSARVRYVPTRSPAVSPIPRALVEQGGRATRAGVLAFVKEVMSDRHGAADLEMLPSGTRRGRGTGPSVAGAGALARATVPAARATVAAGLDDEHRDRFGGAVRAFGGRDRLQLHHDLHVLGDLDLAGRVAGEVELVFAAGVRRGAGDRADVLKVETGAGVAERGRPFVAEVAALGYAADRSLRCFR